MNSLSTEILTSILIFLDPPTLLTCRLVSLPILALIDDHNFYKHLPVVVPFKLRLMPTAGFIYYVVWRNKYAKYFPIWLKCWPSSSIRPTDEPLQMSLMQLYKEIDMLKDTYMSVEDHILAIKSLIICFDIPNVVMQTHKFLIKPNEVWKIIYGMISGRIRKLYSGNPPSYVIELFDNFKAYFCDGSSYIAKYNSV